MPRTKEQVADLVDSVAAAYREIFKEQMPRWRLKVFAQKVYEEAQERFFRARLGHLPPDDLVLLQGVLSPPPEAAPAANLVEIKGTRGRPKKL
jgi:hypothetical protein